MPLKIVRNDITLMNVDAVVNPTNNQLIGIFSTDGAIHKAAGAGLEEECERIGFCETGKAVITGGYNLPAKYIIHTVGPLWKDGNNGEREILENCYRNCLNLAKENGCNSIAFPIISSGTYGFPKDKAMLIANKIITDFLYDNDMDVYLIVYDHASVLIGEQLFNKIESYIDDNYVGEKINSLSGGFFNEDGIPSVIEPYELCSYSLSESIEESYAEYEKENSIVNYSEIKSKKSSKKDVNSVFNGFRQKSAKEKKIPDNFVVDESFFEMVSRYIDEHGWSDPYFYTKANLNKSVFSKMKKKDYRPAKKTAVACALRLELSPQKADELLAKAGFALSNAFLFDIIIKACIENEEYDIYKVNAILFQYDQELLGF